LTVGEVFDEGLVALDLMAVADDMRDLFGEQETQRVLVKADRNGCAGKGGEKAGSGESLNVDNGIVLCLSDGLDQVEQVSLLMLTLVPDEHFMEEGVAGQQGFVPFSYQEIDAGVGVKCMKLFDEGGCKDNVTYKRRLYYQEFLHGCKGRRFYGKLLVNDFADFADAAVHLENGSVRIYRKANDIPEGRVSFAWGQGVPAR
jgi:hypothetical protein